MDENLNYQFPQRTITKGTSNKKILIFISVLVLVIFGFFTVILASRVWDPLWNPFRPSPQKVIGEMSSKMEQIKTGNNQGSIYFLYNSKEGSLDSTSTYNGVFDLRDAKNPKSKMTFNFALYPDKNSIGMSVDLGGEIRTISTTSYFKLTTLPSLYLSMLGVDASPLKDKWIEINQESVINYSKMMGGESFTPEMEKEYEKKIKEREGAQNGFQKEVKRMIGTKKLYLVKKELPDENVGQVKCYHYLISLNDKEFLNLFSKINYGSFSGIKNSDIQAKLKDFLNKSGEIDGELWIGKKDNILYRVRSEKSFDLAKIGGQGTFLVRLNLINSGFNQPVEIKAPSESQKLEDVLGALNNGYGVKDEAIDARLKTDISQASTEAELILSDYNSYRKLCSLDHNSLNGNQSSLSLLQKEISSKGGKVTCYSNDSAYCLSIKLRSGRYFCRDSAGNMADNLINNPCLKATSKCK